MTGAETKMCSLGILSVQYYIPIISACVKEKCMSNYFRCEIFYDTLFESGTLPFFHLNNDYKSGGQLLNGLCMLYDKLIISF